MGRLKAPAALHLVSVEEAARRLGVTGNQVHVLARGGQLRRMFVNVSGKSETYAYVTADSVERLARSRRLLARSKDA